MQGSPASLACHLHEPGCGIHQVHRIATLGQPEVVGATRPAHVVHLGGGRGGVTRDQLARTHRLETRGSRIETRFLGRARVVRGDRRIEVRRRWLAHGFRHSIDAARRPPSAAPAGRERALGPRLTTLRYGTSPTGVRSSPSLRRG